MIIVSKKLRFKLRNWIGEKNNLLSRIKKILISILIFQLISMIDGGDVIRKEKAMPILTGAIREE